MAEMMIFEKDLDFIDIGKRALQAPTRMSFSGRLYSHPLHRVMPHSRTPQRSSQAMWNAKIPCTKYISFQTLDSGSIFLYEHKVESKLIMVDSGSKYWPVTGEAALVTGAGGGIGLEFSRLLLQRGCNVLIADLTLRPESQELVDRTAGKQPTVTFHRTDVTVWADLESAIATCIKHFGRMDIVCPGAGIFEPAWSNFWELPGSAASQDLLQGNSYKTLEVNLTHPIRLTQLAFAHFVSHQIRGRIIHISSIAAQTPAPLTPLYSASKAAISNFVRSFARLEPVTGVRVNGVAPGVVKTPLWTDPQHADKIQYIDAARDQWVMPQEVAEAMMQLLEDEDMPGGTILEVGVNHIRKVEIRNDPGPEPNAPGLGVSGAGEVWEKLSTRLKSGIWPAPS